MRIRTIALAFTLGLFAVTAAQAGKIGSSCTYKGKKLYGKIQVVNAFPDIKVQKVNVVPDKCGKWQFVNAFPDTKVQFVKSFPDVKIQYVNAFPGVP